MSQQSRDGTGALFKNTSPQNETSPAYRGALVVGGVEYRLAAWIKTSKQTGQKYMSLALTPKDTAKPAGKTPARDFHSDEVPF